MLCTMCCHGVKKTDTWTCECGEVNCRHIWTCSACKKKKPSVEQGFGAIDREFNQNAENAAGGEAGDQREQ